MRVYGQYDYARNLDVLDGVIVGAYAHRHSLQDNYAVYNFDGSYARAPSRKLIYGISPVVGAVFPARDETRLLLRRSLVPAPQLVGKGQRGIYLIFFCYALL